AGIVIVQVIDTAEFEVKATVDELDVNQVTVGQAVQVSLDAIPEARLQGTVKSISPMAQTKPGVISYEAVISLPDPGRYALKDGMTTSNEIVVANRRSVLLVPSKAVSQNGSEDFVTVVVDGRTQERAVRTGLSQDGQTEILEGLSQGEKVLVAE
ncbi:MAG: HlyD family efflux transporter periplasmic adaptor subunit, partial [Dehalococcoidia bacterium]